MADLVLTCDYNSITAWVANMESGYEYRRDFVFSCDGQVLTEYSEPGDTVSPQVTFDSLSPSTEYWVSVTISGTDPGGFEPKTLEDSIITDDPPDPLGCTITIVSITEGKNSINVTSTVQTWNAYGRTFRLYGECGGNYDDSWSWTGNGTFTNKQVAWLNLSKSTTYSWSIWLQEKVDDSWVNRSYVASVSGSNRTKDVAILFETTGMPGAFPLINGRAFTGYGYYNTGDTINLDVYGIPEGYEFTKWTKDGSVFSTIKECTYTADSSDHSFIGYGQEAGYEVTIKILNDQGEAKGNKTSPKGAGKYKKEASVTLSTDVLKYYTFDGWYVDGTKKESSLTYKFTMPSEAVECTAYYIRTEPFSWRNTIATGQPITNLTVEDWDAIQSKINLFYAQDKQWTKAGTGSGKCPWINSTMFNEVRNAIANISSPTPSGGNPITSAKTANDQIKASYFDGNGSINDDSIKAALNRIISAG